MIRTIREFADLWGVTPDRVCKWAHRLGIPVSRGGKNNPTLLREEDQDRLAAIFANPPKGGPKRTQFQCRICGEDAVARDLCPRHYYYEMKHQ